MSTYRVLDITRDIRFRLKNLDGMNLIGEDFERYDLSEFSIRCTCLSYANLICVDLNSADLWKSKLASANLPEANLKMAHLHEANLTVCDLRWANLEEANLQNASLYGADLKEANLRLANLEGADLRKVDLKGAIVEHAIFGNNCGLTKNDKSNLIDRGAIFPEDSRCQSRLTLIKRSAVPSSHLQYSAIPA